MSTGDLKMQNMMFWKEKNNIWKNGEDFTQIMIKIGYIGIVNITI